MKYPRTYHLSFSPEIHSDDKVCDMDDVQRIIDKQIEVVITEKIDGGNAALTPSGVYARSHAKETICSSFDYIKNVHYYPNLVDIIKQRIYVFGENMYAIHSIKYTNLKDYFYVFNVVDMDTGLYYNYEDMTQWSIEHNMLTTPLVYSGVIKSMEWLEDFLSSNMKVSSALGGDKEGFVIRVKNSFHYDDFKRNVFKYVRKGHVQTDQKHWSKNWIKATLNR